MGTSPSPSTPSTLVGRDRELGVLREHLGAALAQRGSLVLIGGEAGIGKTALAETVCREAVAQGAFVLVGRCYDLTETPPYGPWVELFAQYEPSDALPLPDAFAKPGSVGEVTSQAALFQQVLDFTRAVAAQRPVLLLLDDLHWADPASLDLLRFLARNLAALRVLLVVTYRADELTRRHPLYTLLPILVRETPALRIDLLRLDADVVRSLVAARYRLTDADRNRLVAYLDERSEGNPFYLGELLRMLAAEGMLRQTDQGWQLDTVTALRVPQLLRQVIDRRVAHLDTERQRLLAVAAVIGQEVPLAVWAAVAAVGEEVLLDVVEAGIEAHLLTEVSDGSGVRFAHALIREALYEGMLATRRRRVHRAVAEAQIAHGSPDPDAVAYHLRHAGDERAAAWLIAAGDRAQRAYAWLTAAERYEAAIALLPERGPEAHERGWLLYRLSRLRRWDDRVRCVGYLDEALEVAEASGDRELAAFARYTRGTTRYIALHEYAEGFADIVAGVAAMVALPPEERERVRAFEPLIAAFPRAGLVTPYGYVGRYAEVLEIAAAIGARSSAAEDDPATSQGTRIQFAAGYAFVGHVAEGRAILQRLLERARALRHYHRWGQLAIIELMLTLIYETDRIEERRRLADEGEDAVRRAGAIGFSVAPGLVRLPLLVVEGRWEEARPLALAVLAMRTDGDYQFSAGIRGMLMRGQGEVALAWDLVQDAVPDGVASEPGIVPLFYALYGQRLAAALCLDAAELAQAHAWLEAHDRWLAWSGGVLGQSEGHALWAQYYRAIGDGDAARSHAEKARDDATTPRQPLALTAAYRLLGELTTDTGKYEDAATHLDTSLALADACAAPFERALTLLAMAELRAAMGESADALALLNTVRTICEPLGAHPTLARADALAAQLATVPIATPAYPAGLSAREVEVLRLVAEGLSNPHVAERLFLSPRTVEQHLRSIFNKTGATSRTAASRFATEHHLI